MQEAPQDKRRVGEDFSGTVVVLLDEQVPPGTDDTLLVHARRSGLDQLVELLLALGNPPTERQVTSVRVQELVEAERARLDGPFPPLRSLTRYWRVDVVEVGVRVESENVRSGEMLHTSTAYLTMVALDEDGNPTEVPPIEAVTNDEKRREREAQLRRDNRLAERQKIEEERARS